ncbi:hypothetical protein Bhyg_03185 [Pseudolycoriella hygida]|uniref:Uncharacterized protein n=1 Tax=Pseudolycoriella hygida TaxID=35572 RepID=A0A9Q0S956_9DIPT|nr:hypothetical protein Bhyg_03185 [Pseudolycoriella hygida]
MKIYSTAKYVTAINTLEKPVNTKSDNDQPKLEVYDENWRNKNLDVRAKLKRQKRCKNSILEPLQSSKKYLPILSNGERIIGTKKIAGSLVTNTCPFDSIFQFYLAMYADSQNFKDKIDSANSAFSLLIQTSFENVRDAQIERSKILLQLFEDDVVDYGKNILALSCEMSIHRMFSMLALHFPILQSYNEKKYCSLCKYESIIGRSFVPTNLSTLEMKNIKASIDFVARNSVCQGCNGVLTVLYEVNEVLVLDVERLDKGGNHKAVKIKDISQDIRIQEKKFKLLGVVENTISHFVIHLRRNDDSFETYDDLKPSRPRKTPAYEINAVLLFFGMVTEESKGEQAEISTQYVDDVAAEGTSIEQFDVEGPDSVNESK